MKKIYCCDSNKNKKYGAQIIRKRNTSSLSHYFCINEKGIKESPTNGKFVWQFAFRQFINATQRLQDD